MLKKIFPQIRSRRLGPRGKGVPHYVGISLRTPGDSAGESLSRDYLSDDGAFDPSSSPEIGRGHHLSHVDDQSSPGPYDDDQLRSPPLLSLVRYDAPLSA